MSSDHNTKLNVRVSGEGYPVVFLHGFLESMSMWKEINVPNITKIEVDLPGHGASDILVDSIEKVAELVMDCIHNNVESSYTVIGHSMGGYVALELDQLDERCEHVILLNSNPWSDSPEKQVDRERVAKIVRSKKEAFIYEAIPNLFHDPTLHDEEVKSLIKEAVRMTPEAIASSSIAMKNRQSFEAQIAKSPDHYTVIQGVNDPIVDPGRMKDLCEQLQVPYFEVRAGHMAHIESVAEVVNALEKEIKKTETN
jgi:pimeloyl-ACP methyl ester carboxylesterase